MALLFENLLKAEFRYSPDARFILEIVAIDASHRRDSTNTLSVKPFAKSLHVEEKVVSAAFGELVEAGVMERLVAPRVGRGGRASVAYTLCPRHLEALAGGSYPQHAGLLHVLFSGADMVFPLLGDALDKQGGGEKAAAAEEPKRGKGQPPGGRGRLSIRNRLLFGVLLSRSDRFGVVQVGLPELGRLTGLKPEQVKTRLSRLMVLGLIRRHVPGLSSKAFASGKVESIYFLNIDALAPQGAIAVHITHGSNGKEDNHADMLFGDCANARAEELNEADPTSSLLRLFVGQQRKVFPLFQHLLYRYASLLLSRYWQSLASRALIEDAELKAWIKRDFIRGPKLSMASEIDPEPEAGKDGAGGDAEQTCSRIYELAIEVAREYRTRFGQLNWVDFEAVDICILPAMDDLGYKSLSIMFQPALVGLGRFSVFEEVSRGNVNKWPAVNEVELGLQNRLDFGLATLPRKVRRGLRLQ